MSEKCRKHCEKKRNRWLLASSLFLTVSFKGTLPQGHKQTENFVCKMFKFALQKALKTVNRYICYISGEGKNGVISIFSFSNNVFERVLSKAHKT